jgi:hypothetical protein
LVVLKRCGFRRAVPLEQDFGLLPLARLVCYGALPKKDDGNKKGAA